MESCLLGSKQRLLSASSLSVTTQKPNLNFALFSKSFFRFFF